MKRVSTVIAAVLLGALLPPLGGSTFAPAEAYPGTNVQLEGAGWGHGRGLGQFGALGYAIDHDWSHSRILDHFYGGTTAGREPNRKISVSLLKLADDNPTIVVSSGGLTTTATGSSVYDAVKVVQVGSSNTWDVFAGSSCTGSFSNQVADDVPGRSVSRDSGSVEIHPVNGSDPELGLRVCEPTDAGEFDGTQRWYPGEIWATRHPDLGEQRTVNSLPVETYLRGVVPREVPASWDMRALKAQAVSARSYALAEARSWGYSDTCDTTMCQVYRGYKGTLCGPDEIDDCWHPRTDEAIQGTCNSDGCEVRKRDGAVARSEFSSSTGGYTAGGTFPAVVDDGDDVEQNPNHRWTDRVPVSSIESRYSSIGRLRTVEVTQRNGKGAWGGRVVELVLRGTKGNVVVSGNEFRSNFGLRSDWFRVVNNPSGGIDGYWVLDHQGGVFTFGEAGYHGSVPGLREQGISIGPGEIVDVAPTPSGDGYWVLDEHGGIFSFGDADFHGSVPDLRRQGHSIGVADIIAVAPTPSGDGYWVLDEHGGMFAFGDADFHGSVPQLRRDGHSIGPAGIVAMTPTRSGDGYWVLDEFGGVFAFGDAGFHGSIPQLRRDGHSIGQADVVGIAASKDGYWMLDHRGGIFAFGDADFAGSLPGAGIGATATGIAPTRTGEGYLIVVEEGAQVHPFGDAPDFGGVPDLGVDAEGRGVAARYRR